MNLEKLKTIINSSDSDKTKEYRILQDLALDSEALPTILKILENERVLKDSLTQKLNLLLSKLDLCVEEPQLIESSNIKNEILDFYKENSIYPNIGHCFKNVFITK